MALEHRPTLHHIITLFALGTTRPNKHIYIRIVEYHISHHYYIHLTKQLRFQKIALHWSNIQEYMKTI